MSKSRGYAYDFVQGVMSADPKNIGVELGQKCIKNRVSVREVAHVIGVTPQTVYWWFLGRFQPSGAHKNAVEKYLNTFKVAGATKK